MKQKQSNKNIDDAAEAEMIIPKVLFEQSKYIATVRF